MNCFQLGAILELQLWMLLYMSLHVYLHACLLAINLGLGLQGPKVHISALQ